MPQLTYRRDIDGLRAVAVLAVVGYHAFPATVRGGFVGVDVFFVISGFLITSILLQEAHDGRFSIPNFYKRRIRRIFPALLVVMASILFAGWFLLLPREFETVGKNTLASALFAANLVLMRGVGYFEPSEDLNPLLHLWSLGVEEQFYIFWPILISLGVRFRLRPMTSIAAIAIASFAFNVWQTGQHPTANFYDPISRFWELLLGAALAQSRLSGFHLSVIPSQIASVFGSILIGVAILLVRDTFDFPGWWALLPTLGSALVILAGENAILNRTVLASPPAVFIGLISYPLYLWHWPLFAFARLVMAAPASTLLASVLVVGAFLLAILTYYLVELPIRRTRSRRAVAALVAGSLVSAMVGSMGALAILPTRAAIFDGPQIEEVVRAQNDWVHVDSIDLLKPGQHATLFIGDSYMQQYYPRIERIAPVSSRGILLRTLPGCAPLQGVDRISIHCSTFVDAAFARAAKPDVDRIVIAASWFGFLHRGDYYSLDDPLHRPLNALQEERAFQQLARTLKRLRESGKKIAIVLSHPSDKASGPYARIARSGVGWRVLPPHEINLAQFQITTATAQNRLRRLAQESGAEIIDPTNYLCSRGKCATTSPSGIPLYSDDTHLRATYVRDHVTYLDKWVQ